MMSHENDVTIGEMSTDSKYKVPITMRGPLAEHREAIARHLKPVEGVKSVVVFQDEPIIIVEARIDRIDDSPRAFRIRLRNKCRDYFHDITGTLTNIGETGNYVDLTEDAVLA